MGERALFVEHPTDKSNRIKVKSVKPSELPWADTDKIPFTITGPYLKELFGTSFASGAFAGCETIYTINLQTFGEGVRVELRTGAPGNSRIVSSSYSRGGQVGFYRLCAGNYFLAIGNDDSVSVTQVRHFDDYAEYSGSITMQRGLGNVSRRSRGSL